MVEVVAATEETPPVDPSAATANGQIRKATPKLHPLTTLRFPAAALAVIGHTFYAFGAGVTFWSRFSLNQGVSFFFILSGFILTYVYAPLDAQRVPRFFVARVARVWPLHLATLLLAFVILPTRLYPDARHPFPILVNLGLLQSWFIRPPDSVNGVSWSLSVELFFYLSFPFLLWCWRRAPLALCMAVVVVACALVLATDHVLGRSATSPWFGFVDYNPIIRLAEFVLGIGTAHLWRYLHPRLTLGRGWGTALEAATFTLVGVVMFESARWSEWVTRTHWNLFAARWEDGAGYQPWFGHAVSWWLRSSGIPMLPFASLILVMALGRGWISRLLSVRLLVLLGEISYAVYLVHVNLQVYYVVHPEYFGWIPNTLRYAAYWGAVVLASLALWAIVEVPCRVAILRGWDRWMTNIRRPAVSDGQRTPRAH